MNMNMNMNMVATNQQNSTVPQLQYSSTCPDTLSTGPTSSFRANTNIVSSVSSPLPPISSTLMQGPATPNANSRSPSVSRGPRTNIPSFTNTMTPVGASGSPQLSPPTTPPNSTLTDPATQSQQAASATLHAASISPEGSSGAPGHTIYFHKNPVHVPEKLTIQLIPRDQFIADYVVHQGLNPCFQLTLKPSKTISFLIYHISDKWKNIFNTAVRLSICESQGDGELLSPGVRKMEWGAEDKITCSNIHQKLAHPRILRFYYHWDIEKGPGMTHTLLDYLKMTTKEDPVKKSKVYIIFDLHQITSVCFQSKLNQAKKK
eukprot:TRINITY_DN7619_c0_g1_i1.p1 TRINITY_DN7619_c0_g1~~TRINITY_DN7619_c0_g1_i1.p1  ORF type:complete len:345 (+),score=44.92 TRINITY_DN7619_c0_g1_i1:84-1037(+)